VAGSGLSAKKSRRPTARPGYSTVTLLARLRG
jgi:hypothetical protein